jgi:oxaloacetate decarboxylase gamma subunit
MLLGMGTVFVFLALLVVVTTIMSTLVEKYGPVQPAGPKHPGATGELDEATLFAVISAAIHAHRSKP